MVLYLGRGRPGRWGLVLCDVFGAEERKLVNGHLMTPEKKDYTWL